MRYNPFHLDADEIHGDKQQPQCCYCGAIQAEFRVLDYDGYRPSELTCEDCFTGGDEGPCFDDLPTIEEYTR